MAKTVGLPLSIAARLIIEQKFSEAGIHIPTKPALYELILQELEENYGISFREEVC
jgi:hypothetical protein